MDDDVMIPRGALLVGTMHFDFTDLAVVAPLTTTMLGWIGIGGREVHDIVGAASLRFLRGFNHPRWGTRCRLMRG